MALSHQGQPTWYPLTPHAVSGEALKAITGLTQVTYQDLDAWSQAMIDGVANYTGDPEIEKICNAATAAIDAAIDQRLPNYKNLMPASCR